MKVQVISRGNFQAGDQELSEVLQSHYANLFVQQDNPQKISLLHFWQTLRNPRKSTPFTWDHFFKVLLTDGIIDTSNSKDIAALGKLIEANKNVQNAFLSLSFFGGAGLTASSDLAVQGLTAENMNQWRVTVSDQLRALFQNNPQLLTQVLSHCPSFVARLHERGSVIDGLVKLFPQTIDSLFARYDQYEDSWDALGLLVNGPVANEKLNRFLIPSDDNTTTDPAVTKLKAFYIKHPRVWHIAIGEKNQNFDRIINLDANPAKMLEQLASTEHGPEMLAEHLNDITQFLCERYGSRSKDVYKFLHNRRKYHDGYGSFAIDLVHNLQAKARAYINNEIEYRELASFAEMVLDIPSVLQNIEMKSDQLAALLRFKNKQRDGVHSTKLEWLLCSNEALFAKMREAGDGAFRNYLARPTSAQYYPRAHASYDLKSRMDKRDNPRENVRAWYQGDSGTVDAQRVYEFVSKDKYWKELFKTSVRFGLAYYGFMHRLCSALSLTKLANYFENKLESKSDVVRKKHVLFDVYFEWKKARTSDSFIAFLFNSVPWLRAHHNRAKDTQIKDIFRFMFNKATPVQMLELCHATGDAELPDYAIEVLNSDPDFVAKYFIAVRATKLRPTFVDKIFNSMSVRTHGVNLLSSNDDLISYTLAALSQNGDGQAILVDTILKAEFSYDQQKLLLDQIKDAPNVLAEGLEHRGIDSYVVTDLWTLYQLDANVFRSLSSIGQNAFVQTLFSCPAIMPRALAVGELRAFCTDENTTALYKTQPWSDDCLEDLNNIYKLYPELLWQALLVSDIDFDDSNNPSAKNNLERVWNGNAGYIIKDEMWQKLYSDEQSMDLTRLIDVIERGSEHLNAAMANLFFDQTQGAAQPFLVERLGSLLEQGANSNAVTEFAANLIDEQKDSVSEEQLAHMIKICPSLDAALNAIRAIVPTMTTPRPQASPSQESEWSSSDVSLPHPNPISDSLSSQPGSVSSNLQPSLSPERVNRLEQKVGDLLLTKSDSEKQGTLPTDSVVPGGLVGRGGPNVAKKGVVSDKDTSGNNGKGGDLFGSDFVNLIKGRRQAFSPPQTPESPAVQDPAEALVDATGSAPKK